MSDATATLSRSRPTDRLSGLPLRRDDRPALSPEQEAARRYQRDLSRHTEQIMGVPQTPTPEQLLMRAVDGFATAAPVRLNHALGLLLGAEADRQRLAIDPEHVTLRGAATVALKLALEARPDARAFVRRLLDAPESPALIREAIRVIRDHRQVGFGQNSLHTLHSRFSALVSSGEPAPAALLAELQFLPHARTDVLRRLEYRLGRLERLAATREKASQIVRDGLAAGTQAIGGAEGLADSITLARRLRGVPSLAAEERSQLAAADAELAQVTRDLGAIEGHDAPAPLVQELNGSAERLKASVAELKGEIKRIEQADALAVARNAFAGDLPSFTAVLDELAAVRGAFRVEAREAILAADWLDALAVDVVMHGSESDEGLQYLPLG
jgi:hypothetical protein